MDKTKLAGIFILTSTLALSGCVARTYELTRDRVDQELSNSTGNRGYIMGRAPEPAERKTTRTTRVFEVELGPKNKTQVPCPATPPLSSGNLEEPAPMAQEEVSEAPSGNFEKYTVAKNDTLQKISQKFYGTTKRWMKIYEANKDVLKGPNKVYPGQVLNIPAEGIKAGGVKKEPQENLK